MVGFCIDFDADEPQMIPYGYEQGIDGLFYQKDDLKSLHDRLARLEAENARLMSELKAQGKRPLTEYNLYVKENMPILRQAYPELKIQDIMTLISVQWAEHKRNRSPPTNNC